MGFLLSERHLRCQVSKALKKKFFHIENGKFRLLIHLEKFLGVNESPIITWGEIEGTPFRLDGSDTPYSSSSGPTFRIPEIPKREKLAMALADKASESYRDKKRKAIEAARSQLSG